MVIGFHSFQCVVVLQIDILNIHRLDVGPRYYRPIG